MCADGGKKIIIISLILVVFIAGFASGTMYYKKFKVKSPASSVSSASLSDQEKACWDQARQRLKDTGFIPSSNDRTDVKSVNGEITNISGNMITLKIQPLEVLADPSLDNRTIEINNATKIYQMNKVAGVIGTAIKSGQSSGNNNANLNYHYENKEVALGDLKIGDKISASSESNVLEQKNIRAKNVFLLPPTDPEN